MNFAQFKNKKMWTLVGSILMILVVLVALLFALAAAFPRSFGWFSSNDTVSGTDMRVVIDAEMFELAVTDDLEELYADNSYTRIVDYLGTNGGFSKVAQTSARQEGLFCLITGGETGESGDAGEIAPGSFGEINFWVIPKKAEHIVLDISLALRGVKTYPAYSEVDDTAALDLLKGHFLFFLERSDVDQDNDETVDYYRYADRIDGSFLYDTTEHTSDRITVGSDYAYPVKVYWLWCSTLGQMTLAENDILQSGHALFEDLTGETDEIDLIFEKIEAHPEYFLYSADDSKDFDDLLENFRANFVELSEGYNDGDQKIGESVGYLVPVFEATPHTEEQAQQPEPEPEPEP